VLGYEIGDRFTQHHMLMRYLERVAATSGRVKLDTIAHSFEGRELPLVILSSEANHARLQQIISDAALVANPHQASAEQVSAAAGRLPAIVWLGYTVHGGEASGTEAAIALVYQLAAGTDRETTIILDSTVVLLHPLQNPDGHERHAQDVWRATGALGTPSVPGAMVHSGSWPGARTSHYYFDLNRDWFTLSHPETRGRIAAFLRWWPHVAVDLHEMGSNSTYFFPPPMPPVNKNIHATVLKWWDIFGNANARAFDAAGLAYFRREGYDLFYAGFGDSWPTFNGAIGMTYEQASSGGGAIRRTDGSVLTLKDAAAGHYTAAWTTLQTSAARARERVNDYLAFRRSAISEPLAAGGGATIRAIAFERDKQGRADSLASLLRANGIRVQALGQNAELRDAVEFGASAASVARVSAGSYLVDLSQPQGKLAKALLEPDAQLDSTFIAEELERRRTAQGNRFYDVTAWSLPFMYRVRAWSLRSLPPGIIDTPASPPFVQPQGDARYGYAIEPGSEAAYRVVGALLSDSVKLSFAPRPFRVGAQNFSGGAFIVRVSANTPGAMQRTVTLARQAGATLFPLSTGAADDGPDLGSGIVFPLRVPKVALLGGDPISGQSFGYTWFAFDQRLGFGVVNIPVSVAASATLSDFNVLVVPSVSTGALNTALGESGRVRLAAWVRDGGLLIALDGAASWLASETLGLSRFRAKSDTAPPPGGGAPLPSSVPGAIVRTLRDSLSPLVAGIEGNALPVLLNSDRIYSVPKDLRPGEVVLRYESADKLRLAGYIWPEVPERIAGTPLLWTEKVGRGRIVAFAGDPNYRDMYRGLLPIFANAVFLGGSF
jgi:hypothetical protein